VIEGSEMVGLEEAVPYEEAAKAVACGIEYAD